MELIWLPKETRNNLGEAGRWSIPPEKYYVIIEIMVT